jgi:hypothetical protein
MIFRKPGGCCRFPPALRRAARLAGLDIRRQIPCWRSGGHGPVPDGGRARWVAEGKALLRDADREAAEGERGRRVGR